MKIYSEQLALQISKDLRPIYLLFGNEPLLKQEALDCILKQSAKHHFDDRQQVILDAQLNWQQLYESCQAMGLFTHRKILQLTLPEQALNTTQTNGLKGLIPLLHCDILLIIDGPKLNKAQESSQWVSLLLKQGVYVVCNTPDAKQMPHFIGLRCKQLGLKVQPQAIMLLEKWHEGNLLALSQSLMMLQLLFPDGNLTLENLQEVLSRHDHYSPFQLTDALIEGKTKRAIRIQNQLEAEGVELIILLRTVQKELIQLYKMQELAATGISYHKIFDQYRVWPIKQKALTHALHRLPLKRLNYLLQQLTKIEIIVKSDFNQSPWPLFNAFCLEMCGNLIHLSSTQ